MRHDWPVNRHLKKHQNPTPKPQRNINPQVTGRLISLVWAFLFSLLLAARAEAALSSNRYLFVVETSRSMQKRTEGVSKALVDFVGSGMRGQLQQGDTLGLW